MTEPRARKSHTTARIIAIAAVPLLYLFAFPWVFFGWIYFVGRPPSWLVTWQDQYEWLGRKTGLWSYLTAYWNWARSVCLGWYHWMHPPP